MATRVALDYLKSLFREDVSDILVGEGENRIEVILRAKLSTLRKDAALTIRQLDEFVERVIEWSGIMSCSCLRPNTMESVDCSHNSKQSVIEYRQTVFSCFSDVKKRITLCCIHILLILDEEINNMVTENQQSLLLGANDRQLILAALQVVISLGLYLNLEMGIGLPIAERSAFGALLEEEKSQKDMNHKFLFICVKVLCHLINNKQFGQLITTKYLGDIFACLMQLSSARKAPESKKNMTCKLEPSCDANGSKAIDNENSSICHHQKTWCKTKLQELLESVYQPLVVRELLMLQGFGRQRKQNEMIACTPRWFQKRCSLLLTRKLMQNGGLRNILQAIFEEYDMDGNETIVRMDMIGYLVSNCPFQASSISEYYTLISEQILTLVELSGIDEKTKSMYMQAASSCISWMLKKDVSLTTHLIIQPLLSFFDKIANTGRGQDLIFFEDEMNRTIDKIHKIFIPKPTSQMVAALSDVSQQLFSVYMLLQRGISHFKSLVHEILIYILQNLPVERSLEILVEVLLAEDDRHICFSNGEEKIKNLNYGIEGKFETQSNKSRYSRESEVLVRQPHFSTEERIDGILNLLVSLQESDLLGKLFLMLLKNLAKLTEEKSKASTDQPLSNIDEVITNLKQSIPTVSMVAAICDKFGDKVLNEKTEIMAFIKATMEHCLSSDSEMAEETESCDLKMEMLSICLVVLSLMLNVKDGSQNYNDLKSFVNVLEKIERSVKIESIARSANEIRISICTHGAIKKQHQNDYNGFGPMSDEIYDAAINDLVDPLVPTRAHAIIQLSSLLERKNPKATGNVKTLIDIFLDNICHDDTYIYLAAIRALTCTSLQFHEMVIPRLAKEFANLPNSRKEEKTVGQSTGRHKIGNVMSSTKRMKIGEALMKSIRACDRILPRYSQIIISSLLMGVKDDDCDIRASSLSNIGEACKLLRFAVGPVINELMSCFSNVLRFDKMVNVKRAALSAIVMLLDGLSDDVFQAIGDSLKDLYQILKSILYTETDDLTRRYAETALEKLDEITKNFLFPKQRFEKKINILHPPDVGKWS